LGWPKNGRQHLHSLWYLHPPYCDLHPQTNQACCSMNCTTSDALCDKQELLAMRRNNFCKIRYADGCLPKTELLSNTHPLILHTSVAYARAPWRCPGVVSRLSVTVSCRCTTWTTPFCLISAIGQVGQGNPCVRLVLDRAESVIDISKHSSRAGARGE
jgi:hypothetical protein